MFVDPGATLGSWRDSQIQGLIAVLCAFQFYQLVYPDQLQSVACDPAQFSAMFVFPAGANVTAVQTGLCDALTSRSTSMQELIDLFQAGDMLVQVGCGLRSHVHLPTSTPLLFP